MKKDFIVVFSEKGARIMKGINPKDWEGVPNVLVNPDLTKVKGIPMRLWKMSAEGITKDPNAPVAAPTITHHKAEVTLLHRLEDIAVSAVVSAITTVLTVYIFSLLR